jgi:hypothetical protein
MTILVESWVVISAGSLVFLLAGLVLQQLLGKSITLWIASIMLFATGLSAFQLQVWGFDATTKTFIFSTEYINSGVLALFFVCLGVLSGILALYYTWQTGRDYYEKKRID